MYKIAAQRTKINFSRNIIFLGAMGIAFLAFGLRTLIVVPGSFWAGIVPTVLGLAFSVIAFINYFEKQRYNKLDNKNA
jgi:CHASE2 domain-containing sensor protein